MTDKKLGFVGGGRVTRILLGGFKKAGCWPRGCVVSEPNQNTAAALARDFPDLVVSRADCAAPGTQDIVFGALHPPALRGMLPELARRLRPDSIFVSLAPKLTLDQLTQGLGGFRRVVRMIPNAPSIVGHGFNPVVFSSCLEDGEQRELQQLFGALGECPTVEESLLEAYAIITGMGPTYLWFQYREIVELGVSFGLGRQSAEEAVFRMAEGAARTMFLSGLPPETVMDLVPLRPLAERESVIRDSYRSLLPSLFEKLTRGPGLAGDVAPTSPKQASPPSLSQHREPKP